MKWDNSQEWIANSVFELVSKYYLKNSGKCCEKYVIRNVDF